jgi:hypothetical protein
VLSLIWGNKITNKGARGPHKRKGSELP